MRIVGLIPARLASTRLPGKVLLDIAGKPMVQHVYERARQSQHLSEVIVATDSDEVFAAVEAFGGVAAMTAADHAAVGALLAQGINQRLLLRGSQRSDVFDCRAECG